MRTRQPRLYDNENVDDDDDDNYRWNETVDRRPLLFPSASELRLTVDKMKWKKE